VNDLEIEDNLNPGDILEIPQVQSALNSQAQKVLTPIAATAKKNLGKIGGILDKVGGGVDTATKVIQTIDGVVPLPDEIKGYSETANNLVGKANGILGKAESGLDNIFDVFGKQKEGDRNYDAPVSLVDWLLEPTPQNGEQKTTNIKTLGKTLSGLQDRVSQVSSQINSVL
jgi:hypothetical protein